MSRPCLASALAAAPRDKKLIMTIGPPPSCRRSPCIWRRAHQSIVTSTPLEHCATWHHIAWIGRAWRSQESRVAEHAVATHRIGLR